MFSYRHIYHAGNYADVVKHTILTGLIESLKRKDAGFCVYDTHAGIGLYDLDSELARKNKEYEQGFRRLPTGGLMPDWVRTYLDTIQEVNAEHKVECYPGSPTFARRQMRPQDRLILTEFNRVDNAVLKQCFFKDTQTAVHMQDAWQGMKAFIPPKLKRGLVLIDPPYELRNEVRDMVDALELAHKKWTGGMFAIWYPIFDDEFADKLRRKVVATGIRKVLDCQVVVRAPSENQRMIGTGMMIINPPWQFDEQLRPVAQYLWEKLSQDGVGNQSVSWLVPE